MTQQGERKFAPVTLILHGFGSDSDEMIKYIHGLNPRDHLVSFNLPYYNAFNRLFAGVSSIGTFDELAPLIFRLKTLIIDRGISKLNVYGFSIGGGVIVNTLMVLSGTCFDQRLTAMGIDTDAKKQILDALRKGFLLLDSPLQDIGCVQLEREVAKRCEGLDQGMIEMCKKIAESTMAQCAERCKISNLCPLNSFACIKHLGFSIILFLQDPDEILTNIHNEALIEHLTKDTTHQVTVLRHDEEGHFGTHARIWEKYRELSLMPDATITDDMTELNTTLHSLWLAQL